MGAKKRMGMVRKQDEPLTLPQLLVFLEVVEEEWNDTQDSKEKKLLEEVASFVCILGFACHLEERKFHQHLYQWSDHLLEGDA